MSDEPTDDVIIDNITLIEVLTAALVDAGEVVLKESDLPGGQKAICLAHTLIELLASAIGDGVSKLPEKEQAEWINRFLNRLLQKIADATGSAFNVAPNTFAVAEEDDDD